MPIFMSEVVQPVLIKDGGLFLTSDGNSDISDDSGSGLGLFHRDTRYLSRYALRIGGSPLLTLMTSAARGTQAVHELTNDAVEQLDGAPLELQSVGVRLERTVRGDTLTLTDRLILRSFAPVHVSFRIEIMIDAAFEDIFELRGTKARKRGVTREADDGGDGLAYRYDGPDGVLRRFDVAFSRRPYLARRDGARVAQFDIHLDVQSAEEVIITFTVSDDSAPAADRSALSESGAGVGIESDHAVLDAVMVRSLRDLRLLRTRVGNEIIAGGMPWFVSPFARDSMLAALQTIMFDTRPAEEVARLFASCQGTRHDAETGEQPGKIAHELRVGAMARLHEIPHHPSFQSVDSTPLFLILVGRHADWTGKLDLFHELRPAIDSALAWMAEYGDVDGDGYLDYSGETADGPINQGWRDSATGVPRQDGSAPRPPIALCEVQGYVYLAKTSIARVARSAGEADVAARLEREASELRTRFNQDFWMEDEGCYALALENGGRQVTVVTSNTGQVLWSGIADPGKAALTAQRLMRPDMNCGWGIRTLSERERAYNPMNYHLGSVWPFDNALIVGGLRRYGLDETAVELFDAILAAAGHFALGRLPEFYVGFQREPDLLPARCPFAGPMQAWSAGAIPYMLTSLLGLRCGPSGPTLERPVLPAKITRLVIRGLTNGRERFDCDVARGADGCVAGRIRSNAEIGRSSSGD